MIGSPVAGAAQRGLQSRDQLARAERLDDVVVRARLERTHHVVLVADRGQHEDRHLAPLADLAADLHAVAVREQQVEDRRVGALQRGDLERLGRRFGRQRLEPRLAHHHLQRTHDVRLVVADEHPRAIAHGVRAPSAADSRWGCGSTGNAITKLVPCPGSDSAHTRPPFASTKPFTIVRPRPDPVWPSPSDGPR